MMMFGHLPRYLVSKGSLLLTLFDADGEQQLLSLQEATQLMVGLYHVCQAVCLKMLSWMCIFALFAFKLQLSLHSSLLACYM